MAFSWVQTEGWCVSVLGACLPLHLMAPVTGGSAVAGRSVELRGGASLVASELAVPAMCMSAGANTSPSGATDRAKPKAPAVVMADSDARAASPHRLVSAVRHPVWRDRQSRV